MAEKIFEPALRKMREAGTPTFGPSVFQSYLAENNLPRRDTAQLISIDSLNRLPRELREAETMVFRLGSPAGDRNTQFALARCVTGWGDYFLFDNTLFDSTNPQFFIPPASIRQLFPFQLLPTFTETSCINLAIASGLLAHALDLDNGDLPFVPATGQSTFSFSVRPHHELGVTWEHRRGQVEVDAVFTARRHGRETVFIVEAKTGDTLESVAKHKLAYPILAIRTQVPPYMSIVPIYLRVVKRRDGIHYYFAECQPAPERDQAFVVSDLSAIRNVHYVLGGIGQWKPSVD